MKTAEAIQNQKNFNRPFFIIDKNLNKTPSIQCIATACENQCIKAVVNKGKLGRTRS